MAETLPYDGVNIHLLIMLKYTNLKQKILKKRLLLLGNDSKDFLVDKRVDNTNMSMISQSTIIVLMLLIFWMFINV